MSSRGIAVLDRKLRAIDEASKVKVAARCEILRLDLSVVLPDEGPFTRYAGLVEMVNDAADDVAVYGREAMSAGYSESLTALRRELTGLLSTIGAQDIEADVMGSLYRAGMFHDWIGVQSEYITTTTDKLIEEADRQWWLASQYADKLTGDHDWSSRLVAPGRVGVVGRRGRSLFSTYPGLLRVAFIDNLWGMVNEDRITFGEVLEAALG